MARAAAQAWRQRQKIVLTPFSLAPGIGPRLNYLASQLLPLDRIGGATGSIMANTWLIIAKSLGIDTGRDNPNVPPSRLTMQQALWGYRGAWAAFRYPTKIWPGSREWKSFVNWLEGEG